MDRKDKEALYMIRERNGIPEILFALEELQRIDREAEEKGQEWREVQVDDFLRR